MEDTIKFQCTVESTDPSKQLSLAILLDDQEIYNNQWVKDSEIVECNLAVVDDKEYTLSLVMSGKTNEHTQLDSNGNIVSDALLNIKNVTMDDIELKYLFNEQSTYTHNYNGNGNTVVEPFNNSMGCNGTVTMKFTTPFYLWLLEKM